MRIEANRNILVENIKQSIEIQTIDISSKRKNPINQYHFHNCFQIVILHEGEAEFMVNCVLKKITKNSAVMFGPELSHGIVNHSANVKATLIHIPKSTLTWVNDKDDLCDIANFIDQSKYGYIFPSQEIISKTETITKKIFKAKGFKKVCFIFDLLGLLSGDPKIDKLIVTQEQNDDKIIFGNNSSNEKALKYIYKNFQDNITLEDIANFANQNPTALCRAFKKANGITIFQFITKLRIEKACSLIKSTDLNITQIAFQVGYNSLSNFNNQFHQLTKKSPTQYRDNI